MPIESFFSDFNSFNVWQFNLSTPHMNLRISFLCVCVCVALPPYHYVSVAITLSLPSYFIFISNNRCCCYSRCHSDFRFFCVWNIGSSRNTTISGNIYAFFDLSLYTSNIHAYQIRFANICIVCFFLVKPILAFRLKSTKCLSKKYCETDATTTSSTTKNRRKKTANRNTPKLK